MPLLYLINSGWNAFDCEVLAMYLDIVGSLLIANTLLQEDTKPKHDRD
jgi:hypothetical protein